MPKNFKLDLPRLIVLVLLGLNLVAGWFVYAPWGGSAGEMEAQLRALRSQARDRNSSLERTRQLTAKMDRGRSEGDQFLPLTS